jgi:carbamate kinase
MATMDKQEKQTLLIALGGNALVRKGQVGTIEEQFENLKVPIRQIARLSRQYKIIITHGNGPQVGNLLLQQESCTIESSLDTALMELGVWTKQLLITLISYVVVDERDPAFQDPTKPIGPVLSREQGKDLPYPTREVPGGLRRVVASPKPVTVVEKREIKRLVDKDFIVICCGGGGIPVIREGRAFHGVDAVIDKDLASSEISAKYDPGGGRTIYGRRSFPPRFHGAQDRGSRAVHQKARQ